ncbi:MAG: hypothetical protein LYZ66_02845 [Nitrososphaerales archaeon]|nr:hypothetical protein [Nitrososphaerales archaeon]
MWNLPEESPFFEDLMQGTSSQSDSEMDDKIDQMTDEAFIALVDEIQRKRRRKIIEVARKLS